MKVLWRICLNDAICTEWKELPDVSSVRELAEFAAPVPLEKAAWRGSEVVLTDPTQRWQYMLVEDGNGPFRIGLADTLNLSASDAS
jgi:hypothetical protein